MRKIQLATTVAVSTILSLGPSTGLAHADTSIEFDG